MINITSQKNGVLIEVDGVKHIHPIASLFTVVNKKSDSISIRYKASRKNVYCFNYKELANPTASSVEEAQSLISQILK